MHAAAASSSQSSGMDMEVLLLLLFVQLPRILQDSSKMLREGNAASAINVKVFSTGSSSRPYLTLTRKTSNDAEVMLDKSSIGGLHVKGTCRGFFSSHKWSRHESAPCRLCLAAINDSSNLKLLFDGRKQNH